jgi:citronellol/citronellal dehydrogenase
MTRSLNGKTLLVTGGSRGIGLAIAVRAAADGANVVLLAKTVEPNPRLPGTLGSAAEAVEAAGGRALAVPTDIRDERRSRRRCRRRWSVSAASTSWSTTPARSA